MEGNWKKRKLNKKKSPCLENSRKIKSSKEAIIISFAYFLFGISWIYFSDYLMHSFISDVELFRKLELYKGAFYVSITTLLIFFLVWKRIEMFHQAIDRVVTASADLQNSNKQLSATKEELSFQISLTEKIIDDAAVIIAVWDEKGMIKKLNPYGEKVLEYTEKELYNRNWIDLLIPKENREQLNKDLRKMRLGHGLKDFRTELIKKTGERVVILWNSSYLTTPFAHGVEIVSVGTDITEQMKIEENRYYQAYYDSLTALPNRHLLETEINNLIEKEAEQSFSLIHIDIDNFKYINDVLGHQTGDIFLKYVADRLRTTVGCKHFVARQGSDEFAILLREIAEVQEMTAFVKRLIKEFDHVWHFHHHEFFISISAGIATYPENGHDATAILKHADIAMYLAKKEGKGKFVFYKNQFSYANLDVIQTSNRLKQALEQKQLTLYYQPQVDIASKEIIGVEALVRWFDPIRGFISPMEFIPLAEETGQIYKLERWIFRTALRQKEIWEQKGLGNIKLSINLSSKTLASDVNFSALEKLLDSIPVDYSKVTLEITETAIITDINSAIQRLESLKKRGISIALDDFGTGYSSLSYLRSVPFDVIKLDRTFINNIQEGGRDNLIIKAILSLVNDLSYEVIAEGIETVEQLEFLQKHQCRVGQGYLFSRPVPVEALEEQLFQ